MENDFFGLLGMTLIIIAWLPEIVETVRAKNAGMRLEFLLLYFLGSASLAYYAWQLNSLPFMVLNTIAAVVPLINLFYYHKRPRKNETEKPVMG